MLCTGFARRFREGRCSGIGREEVVEVGKIKKKYGLHQARAGGLLPIDFWRLCGVFREEEVVVGMVMRGGSEEVGGVQRELENLFNGERRVDSFLHPSSDWSLPVISAISPRGGITNWSLADSVGKEEEEEKTPHTAALARLAQLHLHLLPPLFSIEEDLLRCGHTQCRESLERQRAFLPDSTRMRSCVHGGCGYVSETADEWRRHVGFGCEFHHLERERWNMREEAEEEAGGGRCCGV